MIDTLLHIVLGVVIGALTWLVFQFGPFAGVGLVGALVVYLREVTQRQTRHGLSFEQGWLPWKWGSSQKIWLDTALPVAVLVAGGLALEVMRWP